MIEHLNMNITVLLSSYWIVLTNCIDLKFSTMYTLSWNPYYTATNVNLIFFMEGEWNTFSVWYCLCVVWYLLCEVASGQKLV